MKTICSVRAFARTICALSLSVVALLPTQAQSNVYSFNIVGYVNKPLAPGFTLVANPLDNDSTPTGNTIVNLFGDTLSINSVVQKWTGSSFANYTYLGTSQWIDQNNNPIGPVTLGVGEGAVVWNSGPLVTNTFVGVVRGLDPITETRLPVPVLASGIYLLGSILPASSGFLDVMGRAPVDGDALMKLDSAGNPLVSYFAEGVWHDPLGGNAAPTLAPAESAFFDTTGNQFAGFTLPSGVAVPEPSIMSILGIGVLMLSGTSRKRGQR